MFNQKLCVNNKIIFILTTLSCIFWSQAMTMNKQPSNTGKKIVLNEFNFEVFAKNIISNQAQNLFNDDALKLVVTKCVFDYDKFLKENQTFANSESTSRNYIQTNVFNDFAEHIIIGTIDSNINFFHILLWLMEKKYIDSYLHIKQPTTFIHFLGNIAGEGPFKKDCAGIVLLLKIFNQEHVNLVKTQNPSLGIPKSSNLNNLVSTRWQLLLSTLRQSLPSAIIAGDMLLCPGSFPYQQNQYNKVSTQFVKTINSYKTTAQISEEQASQIRYNIFNGTDTISGENTITNNLCQDFLEQTTMKIVFSGGHQTLVPFMWAQDHFKRAKSLVSKSKSNETEKIKTIMNITNNVCLNFPQQNGNICFSIDRLKNNPQFFGTFSTSITPDYAGHVFIPIVTQIQGISKTVTLFYKAKDGW